MVHDFKRFPELSNAQLDFYYFDSPHKQITEDFSAEVTKVVDGDTIRVNWSERDFDFPIRMLDVAAPERKETGGIEARAWLTNQILGKMVNIIINPKIRVGKWGRILGHIVHGGINMNYALIDNGLAIPWEDREVIEW